MTAAAGDSGQPPAADERTLPPDVAAQVSAADFWKRLLAGQHGNLAAWQLPGRHVGAVGSATGPTREEGSGGHLSRQAHACRQAAVCTVFSRMAY